eukprot:TRINITY_DN7486_c0_g1_i1.p1 TRINITY_DN7486_c0_g1~~TRINITY_DN7486_c0_g1_i1.p1  ORF type:complete len:110 (+),score=12.25 TRINITY_DN7486_c0_g1_i1:119-448(+)
MCDFSEKMLSVQRFAASLAIFVSRFIASISSGLLSARSASCFLNLAFSVFNAASLASFAVRSSEASLPLVASVLSCNNWSRFRFSVSISPVRAWILTFFALDSSLGKHQ